MMPDGELCPDHLKESLAAYSKTGRPTGDFLRACLENDLEGAIWRSEMANLAMIPHVVAYIHWELPPRCSGSPGRVREWIKRGGLKGRSHEANKS